jgi:hypothetical protein
MLMKAAMRRQSGFATGKGRLPAAARLIPFAAMTMRCFLEQIN